MIWTSRLRSLWRNLARRGQKERDLDDEVRAYAAILEDENAARGLTPEEARRQALIEMGGLEQVKEQVREVKMGALLETVAQDVRYGLRTLARAPGFTVAAVLALALGIGATTAIFSVVDAVLLRPLPYREPARLAVLLHRGRNPVAPANFLDWKRDASSFEAMGAADFWQANLTGVDTPERVMGLHVTATSPPDARRPSAARPAVRAGRGRARTRPHRDPRPSPVATPVRRRPLRARTDGDARRRGAHRGRRDAQRVRVPALLGEGAEMWAPMTLADRATNRSAQSLRVFGRLSPGTSLPQARAEMATDHRHVWSRRIRAPTGISSSFPSKRWWSATSAARCSSSWARSPSSSSSPARTSRTCSSRARRRGTRRSHCGSRSGPAGDG